MRVFFLRAWAAALIVAGWVGDGLAQTASPMTQPPGFPQAASFNTQTAPASAKQHASMVRIPGGIYTIGSPAQHPLANRAAMPEHRVTINPFRIDRTEVTNAQFAEFMNALPVKPIGTAPGGKVGPANIAPADRALFLEFSSRPSPYTMIDMDDEDARIGVRDGRFAPNPGHDNHPVAEITWAGALAYCRWRGARLPTEIEWEAAARGMQGRTFPWGGAMPTPELAVIGLPSGTTVPVGSRPRGATPEGLLDMAGSLLEWTSSSTGRIRIGPTTAARIRISPANAWCAAATTYLTTRPTSSSAGTGPWPSATLPPDTGRSGFAAPRIDFHRRST